MKKKVLQIIIFCCIAIIFIAVISALIFAAQSVYWNSLYGFGPSAYDIYRLIVYSLGTFISGLFLIISIIKIVLNAFPKLKSSLTKKLIEHRIKSSKDRRNKKILKYNKLKQELQINDEQQGDE